MRDCAVKLSLAIAVLSGACVVTAQDREIRTCRRETAQRYREYLQHLVRRFPPVQVTDDFPRTKDEWTAHARELRNALPDVFRLPSKRCPLNTRIVSRKEYDGFALQALVYESEPGSSVTANLYLPKGAAGPMPALLFASPHGGWKGAWYNRYAAQLYARAGCVCLTIDPIGAGERCHGGTHDVYVDLARQAGSSIIGKRVWDLLRGVDYLCSRPEVDKGRIGMMGYSLGGTLTMYAAALDERIALAVPTVGVSNFHHMLNTSSLCWRPRGLLTIANQPELVALGAPRCSTLLLHGNRDTTCGPIQGLEKTYRLAGRVYGLLGRGEHLGLEFVDGGHKPFFLRKPAFLWVAQHFGFPKRSLDEVKRMPEVERRFGKRERMVVLDPGIDLKPELMCLKPDERLDPRYSMAGWIARVARNVPQPFDVPKDLTAWNARRGQVLACLSASLAIPDERPMPEAKAERVIHGTDRRTEEVAFGRIGLLSYMIAPRGEAAKRPTVIYLHRSGARIAALDEKEVEGWLAEGRNVLALDTVPGYLRHNFNGNDTDLLMGFPTVAANVRHIRSALDYLATRPDVDMKRISCVDDVGDAGYLAAALDERISEFTCRSRGGNVFLVYRREGVVPDLPRMAGRAEILATLAPRKLSVLWNESERLPGNEHRDFDECETATPAVYRLFGALDKFHAAIHRPPRNTAIGARVTASSSADFHPAANAVDGTIRSDWWSDEGLPQWITVDLGSARRLREVRILFYRGDGRYYRYQLLGSTDGVQWIPLADASKNTLRCPVDGFRHKVPPRPVRYLKVIVTFNSYDRAAHIYEIQAMAGPRR